MQKKTLMIVAGLALSIHAAAAGAACTVGADPEIPDGATATLEQMKAGQAAVKAFTAELGEYRKCLDEQNAKVPEGETEEAKTARMSAHNDAYNASVDREEAVAARFNQAVKAYKARPAQ